MSANATAALAGTTSDKFRFWDSTAGKKAVMAATGVILIGFVLGHMAGNLQIYMGAAKLDAYAEFLQHTPALLWGTRIVVAVCVILHFTAAMQLWLLNRKARPQSYVKKKAIASSFASRTMMWSGPILLAFIIYHLLHLTTGQAHPDFRPGQVYRNMIVGFQNVPASIAYIVAMTMLGTHLVHGVWSMFQTIGVSHPKYTPILKRIAVLVAAALAIGNISIPVSVLTGVLK
jgi:succinate dehydrogenase / fumarate reductase cytochrome b subunit